MTRRGLILLSALLSTSLIAGCGPGGPATGAPSSGEESAVPSQLPSGKPFGSPLSQDPIDIVGVVELGVEHGCTMLRTDGDLYQLIGSTDPLIQPGARLTVRGRPRPDLATTCQQGIPFQVTEVHLP